MNIVSLNEIVECNRLIEEEGLGFRIHLRDACGKQSCYIEPLNENSEVQYKKLYELLEGFFGRMRFQLEYSEDKMNFWIGQANYGR